MRDTIICRFDKESDLHNFNKSNNLSLTKDTTDYWVHSGREKVKKQKGATNKNSLWNIGNNIGIRCQNTYLINSKCMQR